MKYCHINIETCESMRVFEYGCENVLKEKLTKSCKVFPQRVAIQLRTQLVDFKSISNYKFI